MDYIISLEMLMVSSQTAWMIAKFLKFYSKVQFDSHKSDVVHDAINCSDIRASIQ